LPDGRRKSYYGATESEARAKARKANRDLDDGIDLDAQSITVGVFLDRWLESVATDRVRPSTLSGYRGHIEHHIKPAIGRVKLTNLRALHVEEMMASMMQQKTIDGQRVAGVSASTANRVRATLRNALESAVKWRYVNHNAAGLADPRKEKRQRIQPLTPDQLDQFLEFTHDHRYGPLFAFAAFTGLRAGELLALRWQDLDLEDETIHIHHSLSKDYGEGRLNDPKTPESRRSLKLSDAAIDALARQRVLVDQWRDLAHERWQELDLVFPNTIGGYGDNPKITRTLQALLEEAGLPRQRLHDLRHFYATTQLAEGAGIYDVSAMLGHSQITLTADTYGHLTRKLSEDAAKRIDNARKRGR
jgi:integrase